MAAHHCIGTGADERRHWLAPDKMAALENTVQAIAVAGKGISACDESGRTINPRFANVGIEATEEMRRVYRETLFMAPGATDCLTAVILDPETVFQQDSNGVPFPEVGTFWGVHCLDKSQGPSRPKGPWSHIAPPGIPSRPLLSILRITPAPNRIRRNTEKAFNSIAINAEMAWSKVRSFFPDALSDYK